MSNLSIPTSELEGLLRDIESDRAERKESLKGDAPKKVREALCAFANDLPNHRRPGVVFVGARDDGSPSGLAITDRLLRQLADMKGDGNLVPPLTNPNLAEAMKVMGFVQRFGVGLATARRLLRENGNPRMELDVRPTTVSVTMRTRP